jgi:Zn-finger nucleic acid-binding protein
MQEMNASNVRVDICKGGCGGMWFDHFELNKFDEPKESAGEELLNVEKDPNISIDRSQRFKCPKCDDIVMMRHFFSVKKQVEVDECPGCGGVWLDTGELSHLRSLFESEEERLKAADEYFKEIFGEHFKTMEAENEVKLAKTRKFANMFRFICPSYYVSGKQDWGAF